MRSRHDIFMCEIGSDSLLIDPSHSQTLISTPHWAILAHFSPQPQTTAILRPVRHILQSKSAVLPTFQSRLPATGAHCGDRPIFLNSTMSFSSLGLSEEIVRAVTEQGYTTPTPIQMQAVPAVLA